MFPVPKPEIKLEQESRTLMPGFNLFQSYRQKNGLIFSKQNSVLVFLMGQNPKCPGNN